MWHFQTCPPLCIPNSMPQFQNMGAVNPTWNVQETRFRLRYQKGPPGVSGEWRMGDHKNLVLMDEGLRPSMMIRKPCQNHLEVHEIPKELRRYCAFARELQSLDCKFPRTCGSCGSRPTHDARGSAVNLRTLFCFASGSSGSSPHVLSQADGVQKQPGVRSHMYRRHVFFRLNSAGQRPIYGQEAGPNVLKRLLGGLARFTTTPAHRVYEGDCGT